MATEIEITKDRSALENALREAGAEIKGNSCKCPFHDDATPSGEITCNDAGHWRMVCHTASCGFKGDIVDVLARTSGRSNADVLKELTGKLPGSYKPNNGNGLKITEITKSLPEENAKTYTMERLRSVAEWGTSKKRGCQYKVHKVYHYSDPKTGHDDLIVIRLHGQDGKKSFVQAHQDGNSYVFGAPDGVYLPLYRRDVIEDNAQCVITEGEKACEALLELGIPATTAPGGAGNIDRVDLTPLADKRVTLWADCDPEDAKGQRTGLLHMHAVARKLKDTVPTARVQWIDPDSLGLPPKGDAWDFIAALAEKTKSEQIASVKEVIRRAVPYGALGEFFLVTEAAIAGKIKPVPFPWGRMTSSTRALLPKTITMFCGPSGSTKSLMVLNMGMHWFLEGLDVAILMLEDGVEYHMRRALAWLQEDSRMCHHEFYPANEKYVREVQQFHRPTLEKLQNIIFSPPPDKPSTPDYVLAWLRTQAKVGKQIIVIDPITLMEYGQGKVQWDEEARFFREAKRLVEDTGIRLMLVTHPKKGSKGALEDMAGSATFGRAAQTVLWLDPHDAKVADFPCSIGGKDSGEYNRTVTVQKCRNGNGERQKIGFWFEGSTFRFRECGIIPKDS